jgi:hypothetical protein
MKITRVYIYYCDDNQKNLGTLLAKGTENKRSEQEDLATLVSNREVFLTEYHIQHMLRSIMSELEGY